MHFAIVQDRDNNNSDLDRVQNFFRDTTSLTARAHPFPNWVAGTNWDQRLNWNPINSDHYNVITHEKFKLGPKTGQFGFNTDVPYVKSKSKYYKIARRIAFDNVTDTVNWRPFYICMWWTAQDGDAHSIDVAQNQVFYQYKTDVVFKNIL